MIDDKSSAVLLMAYGGPDSLDDIPAYLADIRGGRPTPQHFLDEITERYRLIGGKSPLKDITQSAAAKLENAIDLPVYVGMRHWHPYIKDVILQMLTDGIDHIIAICMAPHYSTMSIEAYKKQLTKALAPSGDAITVDFVDSWHTQPDYLQGVMDNVQSTLSKWPAEQQPNVKVIFTAHSLPERIRQQNDPYEAQLHETAALIAQRLGLSEQQWLFCFQSAAQTGEPWLGPQIETVIAELADKAEQNMLVAPIGFIADHVEVLYDIDIAVQRIAQAKQVRVERTPMLNDSEALVNALTSLAQEYLHTA